jgi:hypothetical protein
MTEAQIQKAVFEHLRRRPAKGVFAWHNRNEGTDMRQWHTRGIFAGLGVVSGMPDVSIVKFSRFYALELKTPKGRLSRQQVITISHLEAAGAVCHTAYGLDAALDWLEREGILVGERA